MKLKWTQSIAVLLLLLGLPHTPAIADGFEWQVNQSNSFIKFSGTQTGNAFSGIFEDFTAKIYFDPQSPESAAVQVAIDSGSAKTGDVQRDEALPGKDWFNVKAFPQITFETNGFTPLDGNHYEAVGTLTVLGTAHTITLPFTLQLDGETAMMTGKITLDRKQLGIGTGPWSEGKWVGVEVVVDIQVEATRAGS